MYEPHAEHWDLRPDLVHLNHGSFGAAPRVVLEQQQRLRDEMESELLRFLAPERDLESKLDPVRERLATFLGAQATDLAWVRNATDGVNAVLRSFPFREGDELVVTDHGYNACSNAARFVLEQAGGHVRVAAIPFPVAGPEDVLQAIDDACTERTRVLLVDHVTSPTGIILPVADIVRRAHERGIRVLVDAAHSPGMFDVDLDAIGADYTTGNLHKWVCAPKVAGFLHVRPEHQHEVRPSIISHAANTPRPERSRFLAEFDWTGTFDPTPVLAVPTALDFLESCVEGGATGLYRRNRGLALEARQVLSERLGVRPPAPESMIGTLVALPLPDGPPAPQGRTDILQQRLYAEHRIEVPVVHWPQPGRRWFRVSAQLYNGTEDYVRLADALVGLLAASRAESGTVEAGS